MIAIIKSGSHLLGSLARVFLSNYLLQRSNTPLILAACSYVLIAAMSGVNYWMWSEFQDYDAAPMELTLYNAIDVILLFYSLKQLNPATYTVIQVS
jgi:uncharacterized membrane protein